MALGRRTDHAKSVEIQRTSPGSHAEEGSTMKRRHLLALPGIFLFACWISGCMPPMDPCQGAKANARTADGGTMNAQGVCDVRATELKKIMPTGTEKERCEFHNRLRSENPGLFSAGEPKLNCEQM
jgi:hypothetical protein